MMHNRTLNLSPDSPIHLNALAPKDLRDFCAADRAEETWEHFFHLSRLLPAGAWLAWQMNAAEDPSGSGFVHTFSSPGCPVTQEDLGWIFRETAELTALPEGTLPPWPQQAHTYILRLIPQYAESDPIDAEEEPGRRIRRHQAERLVFDLWDVLRETGASFRLICGPDAEKGSCRVTLFLAFPQELTLHARTVLSCIFPYAHPVETDGTVPPGDGFHDLPADLMEEIMIRLVQAIPAGSARKADEDEDEDEDEAEDEDEDRSPDADDDCDAAPKPPALSEDTPIEALSLSVRAFNALLRAGIRTLGDLRRIPACNLPMIRGIGLRQINEIRQLLEGPAPIPEKPVNYRALLDSLIGLDEVKMQVRRIEAYARMKRDMASRGIPEPPMALNMAFLGNPGTAKTTVARILAGILHEIGILSGTGIVEVGRAGLVGKYVGHTADRVREVFREARGRLLFIDEAYSLVDSYRSGFGDEAINTIVQEMENHRNGTVVVFAGYPREMEEFIARNPGLSSRIPFTVRFEDYSPADLARIVRLEAERRGFSLDAAAAGKVRDICGQAAGRPGFGNGRFCRNLAENAILSFADRVYGSGREQTAEPSAPAEAAPEFILSAEDFEEPRAEHKEKPRYPIGFCA